MMQQATGYMLMKEGELLYEEHSRPQQSGEYYEDHGHVLSRARHCSLWHPIKLSQLGLLLYIDFHPAISKFVPIMVSTHNLQSHLR